MKSVDVRRKFLDFFKEKGHRIVPSAPMVVKNDPTLMFTNAGMNQFKDVFLANTRPASRRIANTQKCLRVSGKHNDLEEVGYDTYHHTMFEMLGNWSFGDYFKKEAIAWAWELLTDVYNIDEDRLYATVFGGDPEDGLGPDEEAYRYWHDYLSGSGILYGSKKDNFWEMGDTGPCGPCSEIHIDLRDDEDRMNVPGAELVNKDHPEVIEIWNLVFIEYNRKADHTLSGLPSKHVDTGMGFERLCMALQGKRSNYDTDIFQPLIHEIEHMTSASYGNDRETDIAMRVVSDHLRAVAFAIADGQLPSNIGAGYVIRRILRRAVRYGYTFLGMKDPYMGELLPVLGEQMSHVFPELESQQALIRKVITEEERSFLRTLSAGIKRFESYVDDHAGDPVVKGDFAFELFDTYGFPVDLTRLMAREKGWQVDMKGFYAGLEAQKARSRKAASRDAGDWIEVDGKEGHSGFMGYDSLEYTVNIKKYRKVRQKKREHVEMVLDKTPFYAESGGQVGDTGYLRREDESIRILDTKKEHDLIVHIADREPQNPHREYTATVDRDARQFTANNHTASHLLHYALRKVLGEHVEQKGSLVDPRHLRFDFSHFEKIREEDMDRIEKMVNSHIRENIPLREFRSVPIEEARKMGALAFFGEKYGDEVRVISFGDSVELCGGTHVDATGRIGLFKIVSESAVAAGVRRIEALTAAGAEAYMLSQEKIIRELKKKFKTQENILRGVQGLIDENNLLRKDLEKMKKEKAAHMIHDLEQGMEQFNGVDLISTRLEGVDPGVAREIALRLTGKHERLCIVMGYADRGKAYLTVAVSRNIAGKDGLHAGNIVKAFAGLIKGGGGGQAHFATAGGGNIQGIPDAIKEARKRITAIADKQ